MSVTYGAGADWTGGNAELIDLALAARPRISDQTVWRSFQHGVVVWGHAGQPVALSPHQAVVWPFLDGTVTAGALAEDLSASSGLPLHEARADIATLVVRAFSLDWATGLDALGDWFEAQEEPPTRPDVNRTWVREIAGERWCFMEVTRSTGEMIDVVDGRTSPAELWPPDSCGGRAMHLDRPAERITLAMPGHPLAVRTADPDLVAWLETLPQRSDRHAPVHVFVAASTADVGRRRPTHYRLFNGLGHLVAAPIGLEAAQRALASMVVDRMANADTCPDGWLIGARSITDGERTVLATAASIEGGSHLLNHLRRLGVAMDPTPTVILDPDGRRLRVPHPPQAVALLEAGTLRDPWVDDLWVGRKISQVFLPVGATTRPPAERAIEVLRDTQARSGFEQRNGLLDAVGRLLAAVPVSEEATPEQSPLMTARQLRSLLG